MSKRRPSDGGEMNMTPMIDVVFQLIIFFVVTLKLSKEENPDIDLENGKTLGMFGPGDRTIPVPLDADCRCRLVLIEPDI